MIAKALSFSICLTFIPIMLLAINFGGWLTLGAIIYVLMIIPVLDFLLGMSKQNLDLKTDVKELIYHNLVTWIWVPVQLFLIFFVLYSLGNDSSAYSPMEIIGLAVSLGFVTGGIGITYAHELIHQKNRFERFLGEILLGTTLYSHFCIEHLHGHHVNVGTPKDPVSAHKGQNFFEFYPRAVIGSFISAIQIQDTMLKRKGDRFFNLKNPFLRYLLFYSFLIASSYALAGWLGIGVFVLQAVVAFSLLEIINYVEHYGLRRRKNENGKYEHVQTYHSWNSSYHLTNLFLINLQRHSDHHKHPSRRYPLLQHHENKYAPELPFSYPVMLILALVPPVWFKIMNPLVDEWERRHYPNELRE